MNVGAEVLVTVVLTFEVLLPLAESSQPLGTVTVDVALAVPAVVGVVANVIVAVAPVFRATLLSVAVLPEPLAVPQLPVPVTAQVHVVLAKLPGSAAVQPAPPEMLSPLFDIVMVIVVAEPAA